jgi:hypothetical protein
LEEKYVVKTVIRIGSMKRLTKLWLLSMMIPTLPISKNHRQRTAEEPKFKFDKIKINMFLGKK